MINKKVCALLLFGALSAWSCADKAQSAAPSNTAPAPSSDSPMPSTISKISLRDVATFPKPGTVIPGSLAFTANGKHVTFLYSDDKSLSRQLYAIDLEKGERTLVVRAPGGGNTEENLSAEEKLERERRRERGLGVTRYSWSKEGDTLLVPLGGDLLVQNGIEGELRVVVDVAGKPALSPRLSRDGSMLAYVNDDEVYAVSTTGGTPRQLSSGARGSGRSNGLAEYIAQEEMGRYAGYWWSDDAKHIAYTEIDETHIPQYRIVHQGKAGTGEGAEENHGYPFAGAENARVRLGVVPTTGGKTRWMDLGDNQDIYLARVHWMPDGQLWAEIENREQSVLDLVKFDLRTGKQSPVLREESDVWINLHKSFKPLRETEGEAAGGFVWASERSGFMHLYLYDAKGKLLRPLTSGEWPVDSVAGINEEAQEVYFLSGKGDPTQRQLYAVSFAGGEVRQITSEPGSHGIRFNKKFTHFIDTHASMTQAPRVLVRSMPKAELVSTIFEEVDDKVATLGLEPPELVTLKSRDGVTLHGAIYRPPSNFTAPYPTVVSVYGGPHAQRVADGWGMTVDLRAQYLRSQGYLVFKLDNRGSARRGLAFEGALRHDMGNIELQDQVDGVQWLVDKGLAKKESVGIYGWSYGGYMTAMALARAPETFSVGVAGASVTHWDGYDTHYTERYMGTPKSNPKGYQESSVMHHLGGLQGKLMLVHGLIDENVHFRHTARLIDALIKAQKEYELLCLAPSKTGSTWSRVLLPSSESIWVARPLA
jgi:dipeptidyl-peptidase-4